MRNVFSDVQIRAWTQKYFVTWEVMGVIQNAKKKCPLRPFVLR